MKSILVAVIIFTSFNVHARIAVSTGQYSMEAQNTKRRCSVQECKLDDNGRRFLSYCKSTIQPLNGNIYVMNLHYDASVACYCPCQLGFIGSVMQSNQ